MRTTTSLPPRNEGARPLGWQGRQIASLTPDGTWRKSISKRNQWCYKHDAPGVQASVWDAQYARGAVQRIEVHHKPDGCVLRLSAEAFVEHAIRDTLNASDGEQLFVPREFWHVEYLEGHQFRLPLEVVAAS